MLVAAVVAFAGAALVALLIRSRDLSHGRPPAAPSGADGLCDEGCGFCTALAARLPARLAATVPGLTERGYALGARHRGALSGLLCQNRS